MRVLAALLSLSPFLAATSDDPGAGPTNVLILLADDIGVDMVGVYDVGPATPSTPNLDLLAAGGMMFTNAWTYPNCSPTRATIQTGRFGFRTGMGTIIGQSNTGLPLDEVTLPEMLDLGTGSAWEHAAIGKWHLGDQGFGGPSAPNLAGYDHFSGTPSNLAGGNDYFSWTKTVDGVVSPASGYATTDSVDSALDWIDDAAEPWMCYVAFHAPHSPYHIPPAPLHSVDFSTEDTNLLRYQAMVEAMDAEIGRLLTSLDPAVAANTTVIFLGDNGTPREIAQLPFQPTHAKGTLFEGGVNVPFIVWGPLVGAGTRSEALVHSVDLFATVADIAGVDLATTLPTTELDSISLLPYFADPATPSQRDVMFTQRFSPNGPGNPVTPPECDGPPDPVCQEDLGFGGPGTAVLSMCGPPLYGGSIAELKVEGVPPLTPLLFIASLGLTPVPILGGIFAPSFPYFLFPATSNAIGEFEAPFIAGGGPISQYIQVLAVDTSLPFGIAFSNALELDLLGANLQAARNDRYKLHVNLNLCEELFFDLELDPFEENDLLLGTLTPAQDAAYLELKAFLDALNGS